MLHAPAQRGAEGRLLQIVPGIQIILQKFPITGREPVKHGIHPLFQNGAFFGQRQQIQIRCFLNIRGMTQIVQIVFDSNTPQYIYYSYKLQDSKVLFFKR